MFYCTLSLKKVKDMFKKLYILLLIGAALACKASPSNHAVIKVAGSNDLQPDAQQSVVCQYIASIITEHNYKKVTLNDSISAVVYDRYIKALDENHNYLLASDIKDFEKYKTVLDDDLKSGNLSDVFYIFNVYQKRYNERIKYSISELDKNFDFNGNETFTFDRDSLPYAASETEMNNIWSERVKYDMLNLKLANPDLVKDKATLKKRYEGLLTQ